MREYQAHKKAAASRDRILSLIGRDISPLPAIESPRRRIACRGNLRAFLETYYPQKFRKPFGKNHIRLIESLERIILHDGRQAVAMPRGTGKTTITSIAAGWALAYGYRRFIAILSANHRESKKMMKLVLNQFITPSAFTNDFPEICFPLLKLRGTAHLTRGQLFYGEETRITFSSDTLVFPTIPGSLASGSAVLCAGVGSAIRGLSVELPNGETIRPDMVLLDDIQTGDVARNPDRVEKLEQEIASTIDGLAESGHEMAQVLTITVNESGDLADRFLDPAIYPWWNGIRGRMVERFPDRMDLWREFRSKYFTSEEEAHRYYLANRKEMSAGAEVSWPEDYDPKHYADALEYAMTKWSQNERAFFSERQNSPTAPPGSAIVVPAKTIMSRVNGLPRRVCPYDTYKITGFIDVHDDLLYWVAVAWTADFTGYVIDYGTFPEQSRQYFDKRDGGLETLQRLFNSSPNASLKMGLELLIGDFAGWEFDDETGKNKHGVDRVFIDSKYKPEIVEAALRVAKTRIAVPAKGVAVKATNRPMAEWPRKNSRKFLYHLIDEKIEGRAYRSVLVDSNFWKSFLHEKFSLNPGEKGSLTFWGTNKRFHRMVADHCNAETVQLVSSGSNEVNQWREKPLRPDNHFFDCLAGALAAASTCDLKIEELKK